MDILFDFDKNIALNVDREPISNNEWENYDEEEYYELLCQVYYVRFYDEEEKRKYIELCKQNDILFTAYGLDKGGGLSFVFENEFDEFRPLYEKVSELYDELNQLREIELLLNPDYKENSF